MSLPSPAGERISRNAPDRLCTPGNTMSPVTQQHPCLPVSGSTALNERLHLAITV
jgi:hypothetical protein